MAKKPYYTSQDLIDAVKRKMAFPQAQVTFTDQEILDFANEEMFLAQVPSIMEYHEEYLVYPKEVALQANVSRYPIPNRAIGMKLRDLFYKDTQGELREMSKINPDDKAFFAQSSNNNNTSSPIHYYIQNNSIVLVPDVSSNPQGSLFFTYFLRPNSLVENDKAVVCTGFSKTLTVTNASLTSGDILTIGSNSIVADTSYAIGADSAATAANLSNYINTLTGYTATSAGMDVQVNYSLLDTTISSDSAGISVPTSTTIVGTNDNDELVDGNLIDFLQTDGGHCTYSYDVRLGSGAVSTTGITFPDSDIPSEFVIGDYVCNAYECIVPQVPTDLHNLLAERTCARILESLGDQQGLATANTKIQELEARQATIIDSRVDGSPTKIFNRHSLLRYGKSSRNRGGY